MSMSQWINGIVAFRELHSKQIELDLSKKQIMQF